MNEHVMSWQVYTCCYRTLPYVKQACYVCEMGRLCPQMSAAAAVYCGVGGAVEEAKWLLNKELHEVQRSELERAVAWAEQNRGEV